MHFLRRQRRISFPYILTSGIFIFYYTIGYLKMETVVSNFVRNAKKHGIRIVNANENCRPARGILRHMEIIVKNR